jgi:hypothetical protein
VLDRYVKAGLHDVRTSLTAAAAIENFYVPPLPSEGAPDGSTLADEAVPSHLPSPADSTRKIANAAEQLHQLLAGTTSGAAALTDPWLTHVGIGIGINSEGSLRLIEVCLCCFEGAQ